MAKKKAKIEIDPCEKCLSIPCECQSCKLCEISGECLCSNPVIELADAPAEAVELHICADELCCIQTAPEPAMEAVEPVLAPVVVVEAVVVDPPSAGQGCWDVKYNMARRSKSPAARKYIPVHRQR